MKNTQLILLILLALTGFLVYTSYTKGTTENFGNLGTDEELRRQILRYVPQLKRIEVRPDSQKERKIVLFYDRFDRVVDVTPMPSNVVLVRSKDEAKRNAIVWRDSLLRKWAPVKTWEFP